MEQWMQGMISLRYTSKSIKWALIQLLLITSGDRGEIEGFDQHFAPTSDREHSYRYESYDKRYKTLKIE